MKKLNLDWYKVLAISIMVICSIITIYNIVDMIN
jgi:hypothetical protein